MRHVAWLAASAMLAGCAVTPEPHAQTPYPGDPVVVRSRAPDVSNVPTIAGRISIAQGDVRIWRTDEDGSTNWDDAEVNDVVTSGSRLWTNNDARTEVRFGPHVLRLAGGSVLRFDQLDEHHAVVHIERGTLTVRLHSNDYKDTLTVLSGTRSVELRSPGRYRIEGDENASLRITSFRGEAVLRSAGNTLSLREGRSLDVSPDGSSLNYGDAVATAFDEWSLKRDERLRDAPSARYVSPYMTGYEELDANGDWVTDATYGTVWVPRVVAAGWVPYRQGRWRWVSPWGWTWVDEAPWGFAPFHYGRWVFIGAHWCWWPGAYVARPVYAPALVGWVGRPGWSVSVSVGSPAYVGWYPLAPWHAYQPRYITNVQYNTVINQTIIKVPPAGVSLNQNLERGGTAVPGQGFREPIHHAGGTPLERVVPVRDVQPLPPPAHMVRGPDAPRLLPGERLQPSPAQQQPPRPGSDRDVTMPQRQDPGQPPRPRFDRDPLQPNRQNAPPAAAPGAVAQPTAPQPPQVAPDPRVRSPRDMQPGEPRRERDNNRGRPFPERLEPAPAQPQPQPQAPQLQQRGNPMPAPAAPRPDEERPRGWRGERPQQIMQAPPPPQPQPQPQMQPPPQAQPAARLREPEREGRQPQQRGEREHGDREHGDRERDFQQRR